MNRAVGSRDAFTIGHASLTPEEAWLFLQAYSQDAVLGYDFAGCLDTPPQAGDTVELRDFGRILALGIDLEASTVGRALSAGASADWSSVPADLTLASYDPELRPDLLSEVTRLYSHFRYHHRLGSTRALALLHLRRPLLIPVLTDPLLHYYGPAARKAAADFGLSAPMFYEAVRRDLVSSAEALQALRRTLAKAPDRYTHALAALSDVRLFSIVAHQLVASGGG